MERMKVDGSRNSTSNPCGRCMMKWESISQYLLRADKESGNFCHRHDLTVLSHTDINPRAIYVL